MKSYSISIIVVTLLILVGCGSAEQTQKKVPFESDYATYGKVLSTFLKGDRVDYKSLKAERDNLDNFINQLATLSSEEYERMSRHEKMALLINAYNGITLRSVIDAYPVKSIRDIDGVWKKHKWLVAGRKLTLDEIEHKILRPQFKDPRVHFAVNCASIGCPPLAHSPYLPARLDQQLDSMAANFVNDSQRNRLDLNNATIHTSEIFSWFGDDFIPQYGNTTQYPYLNKVEKAVLNFMNTYASPETTKLLESVPRWKFSYESYDWSLNDID